MGAGLVTMVLSYRDGGDDDPWVGHGDGEPDCTVTGGQPHRMSECGMFDHRRWWNLGGEYLETHARRMAAAHAGIAPEDFRERWDVTPWDDRMRWTRKAARALRREASAGLTA